jgi:hypothetical protein
MKRTQLYLEESMWKALEIRARQEHVSVSELVREAIREKYLSDSRSRRETMLKVVGLWKNRTDLGLTATYVRSLRKDDRLKRFFR